MATFENMVNTGLVAIVIITTIAVASAAHALNTAAPASTVAQAIEELQNRGIQSSGQGQLKRFSSYAELVDYLKPNIRPNNNLDTYFLGGAPMRGFPLPGPASPEGTASNDQSDLTFIINNQTDEGGARVDFSKTNIQVEGVDEADIAKTDGKFIYIVSGDRVIIIDAYPAENAKILAKIDVDGVLELYINVDKLILLGSTYVKVYDVSNRENPVLKRDVSFNGSYFRSRMIGGYVYIIVNSPVLVENIVLPYVSSNGDVMVISATEIYYFENLSNYSYNFTTIMTINAQNDDEDITSGTILMSSAQDIFVSTNNIYITYTVRHYVPISKISEFYDSGFIGVHDWGLEDKTMIHRLSISKGTIRESGKGEVPGRVLNQFSMDEYQGYFRIATTTGQGWGASVRDHVYVLDEDLNIIGRLEGIAPGERIFSARFMGNRAYLVTFEQIDPLFVIDLADPQNPRVLGELEIPGFSDYLHPYDETHIIGIGKDTIDAGSFSWRQGVKISLFDVSDPENPREISKYLIGDRGTEWGDSYALSDHRAFLFDRERNLLVVPIELAERDESSGASPWTYGRHVWQGAYVFHISLTDGLVLRGRITHSEDNTTQWLGRCHLPNSVRRSLYIDNVLYTISDGMVKMNDLTNLSEINSIELPQPVLGYYPEGVRVST